MRIEGEENWFKRHKLLTGVIAFFVLVVIALIVTTGSSKKPATTVTKTASGGTRTTTSTGNTTTSGGLSIPAAAQGKQILNNTAGKGNNLTDTFSTNTTWQLTYDYDCTGEANPTFQIYSYDDGQLSDTLVSTIDTKGTATIPVSDAGNHYLEVSTPCSWHVTVAQ